LALLQEHAGYLYAHGHALALAQHVFQQACLKLDPATAPTFFAEVLNNGGSAHYGLGAAVEEARQWGVLVLPPCINRSTDRYTVVDPDAFELLAAGSATSNSGAIRVPLTAIRGLRAETVRHILQMRAVFGPFTSLLDFLRGMEPQQINRRELQVLVRLGAFSFTADRVRSWRSSSTSTPALASCCARQIAIRRTSPTWRTNFPRCSAGTPLLSSGRRSGLPPTSSPTSASTSCRTTCSSTRSALPRSFRPSTLLLSPDSNTTPLSRSLV
jgi:hypothetical protein